MRILTLVALVCGVSAGALLGSQLASAGPAQAAQTSSEKAGKSADKAAVAPSSDSPKTNACGCYEDDAGMCRCAKKNQCGCPGECEPAGCEEKRQKQLAKEAEEELKRQQQEDKKRNAELAKKQEELERQDAQKRERGLRGLRLIEDKK